MNKNILHIINQIRENFHPEKIILFGSHAYGKLDKNSDIDILVIMNHKGSARDQAVNILQNLDLSFLTGFNCPLNGRNLK